ncbi:MAG: UbiA family prenyltransferase [Myxococcales bacterium]|nr:UbiA family prenyltransferase [Myxococcales bacterium]
MARLARIAIYFRRMFPLQLNLPAAAFMFYGFYAMAQATGPGEIRIGVDSLFGFGTFFLSLLLLRLVDELKDEDVDPDVFPDRPLVTGEVRYADVRLLALLTILSLLALNLGRGLAAEVYLVYFVFFVLSWQWWMFPDRVAPSLALVLVTHGPLIPLLFAYAYAVYVHTTGEPVVPLQAVVLCGAFWIPMLGWEIARKVRAPDEETDYLSYTRRWGTRRAAAIPLLCVLAAGASMIALGAGNGFSRIFTGLHLAAALVTAGFMASFLRRPRRAGLLVLTPMVGYLLVFYVSVLLETWLAGGAPWRS